MKSSYASHFTLPRSGQQLFVSAILMVAALFAMTLPSLAADSAISATAVTNPSGVLWLPGALGGHLWIADHAQGFCRLDANAPGSATPLSINSATCNLAALAPGQPDFDSVTNFVYVPDTSSKSQGVWRLIFDPASEKVVTDILLAAGKGLGSNRPSAVALGRSDNKLYMSALKNGNIVRITTPSGPSQNVESVGGSSDGARITSIAFIGSDLYLSQKAAVTRIVSATSAACTGGCKGATFGPTIAAPVSVTADVQNGALYIADLTKVYRFTLATSVLDTMTSHGILNGVSVVFQNINGLGLDTAGNLFIADDPTAGLQVVQGRLWMLPAGSTPDVGGGLPPPPTGLTLSAQYATGLTAPYGPVFLPDASGQPGSGHMWVSDHALGFCRLDPMGAPSTLYAINASTCSLAVPAPGQPSFDPITNSVYLPDSSAKSQGVWRLTFDPVTETVKNPFLLAPGKGLAGNKPLATALGVDGKLYVTFLKNGSIVRVTTPSGATQNVEAVGSSSDSRKVVNLAFIGNDLYLAETGTVTRMIGATSVACAGGCKAASLGLSVIGPQSLTSDGAGVLFIGDASKAYRYTLGTNLLEIYSAAGTYNGTTLTFSNVSGLARDAAGNLYIADDPTAGVSILQGRIWKAPLVP